ncbi:MAG: hypothetical protein Q4G35_09770 [Propionibacteriaceae bacterium]|nr:hypothetical protein [Propionibacteriaceae bacterium]
MVNYQLLRTPIQAIAVDDSACDVNDLAVCGGVQVTVPGTEPWADFVRRAADSDWTGIEALAAFDGTVADAVRENFAAFGQEVRDSLMSVRTWDLEKDAQRTFAWADARLGDGTSALQEELDGGGLRYEILDVHFLFRQGDLTRPVTDASLLELLGVEKRTRVPLGQVVDAVLAAR